MKSCKDIQENLELCVLNELSHEEKVVCEEHLQTCAVCRHESEEIRDLIKQVKEFPVDPGESFFRSQCHDIQQQIAAQAPTHSLRLRIWLRPLALAAVLGTLIYGVQRIERRRPPDQSELQAILQTVAIEEESEKTSMDLDEFNGRQLNRLALLMERKILLEEVENWEENSLDLDELSDTQINDLQQRLKTHGGNS